MYDVDASSGNLQKVVRRDSGDEVPLDLGDQSFNDFLTWYSANRTSQDDGIIKLPHGHYFSSMERLVEHCKANGYVLFAVPVSERQAILDVGGDAILSANGARKHIGLVRAVASGEGTWPRHADGLSKKPMGVWVTHDLYERCCKALPDEDSDVRKLSTWPVVRAFAYFDVSDYSKFPPSHQMMIVNAISALVSRDMAWPYDHHTAEAKWNLEGMLCIGDGYILVFKDAMSATYFSAGLARAIELYGANGMLPVPFHFRAGVHVGPVYRFWDAGRNNWNYIGDGINGGQRVLTAIGKETDDVLFISGQVRDALLANSTRAYPFPETLKALQNRGRRQDKHGQSWRVYELHHTQLCDGFFVNADPLK